MKLSDEAKEQLLMDADENKKALENKPRFAKYPWAFQPFEGAELSEERIDHMIREMLAKDDVLSTYTGDTKIKLTSWGDIHIWKHTATYKKKD